ncbi:hypothetical protein N7522_004626 [Penicillium canescens]|uniref:Uncharacterized protein n=1 Tax=Penicillium canescens TaxID=5083 RepID=A0AAD6I0Y7_PENCN|nr:uncharacterized protein N7446_004510 [Penicillium canescens]KAJ6009610.1 hypothetical protein N7522_004626 [Penicillium canescens]KAJ6026889.1 hypothetical protein N7460_011706 [Penicillium canescens]KAJ6040172.1 hypothetical protein N7444_009077 [Penicillium canescens]KAJ6067473.1 hypothetical protein N7446_004510 [Penicillium canescens]
MAQTYLSNLHMEKFISEFEQNPTHETMEVMVSALLVYAFDSEAKWAMNYKPDPTGDGSYYFAMQLDGRKKILHAIIKVISTAENVSEDWDLPITPLAVAPLPNERCWAVLFQGMTMRLYEYHRDQPAGARLLVCDFKVDGKKTDTLHIRDNCRQVNSVLFQIPEQHPKPLSDAFLQLQAKALEINTAEGKHVDGKTPGVEPEGEKAAVEVQPMDGASADVKPTALSTVYPAFMPSIIPAPAVNTNTQPKVLPNVQHTLQPTVQRVVKRAATAFKPGAPAFNLAAYATAKIGTLRPMPSLAEKTSTQPKVQPTSKPAVKPAVSPAIKTNTKPKVQAAATLAPSVDLMTFADLNVGAENKANGRAAPAPSLI